jgi:hypothetical protein
MYDIYFIGKPDWGSYSKLKERFPTAKCAETVVEAKQKCLTKHVWIVYHDLWVKDDFNFDYKVDDYDKDYTHVFLNERPFYDKEFYDGIALMPKNSHHGPGELRSRFYINKKFVPIVASNPRNEKFEAVFISYNEPNADENYQRILDKFPDVKRVHGVKGIHQAHIEAAKLCNSRMFFVVDGDAQLTDYFKFNYAPEKHNWDAVHVWRSENPINGLIYGYGGVKLLPRNQTIDMDTSKPDMTTSISNKFVAVQKISNITAFNSDPFSTWKGAFRECVKLSSKIIDRQKNDETNKRLRTWCTYTKDNVEFAEYALKGAKAGAAYGARYSNDPEALKMINDFDWLKDKFDGNI